MLGSIRELTRECRYRPIRTNRIFLLNPDSFVTERVSQEKEVLHLEDFDAISPPLTYTISSTELDDYFLKVTECLDDCFFANMVERFYLVKRRTAYLIKVRYRTGDKVKSYAVLTGLEAYVSLHERTQYSGTVLTLVEEEYRHLLTQKGRRWLRDKVDQSPLYPILYTEDEVVECVSSILGSVHYFDGNGYRSKINVSEMYDVIMDTVGRHPVPSGDFTTLDHQYSGHVPLRDLDLFTDTEFLPTDTIAPPIRIPREGVCYFNPETFRPVVRALDEYHMTDFVWRYRIRRGDEDERDVALINTTTLTDKNAFIDPLRDDYVSDGRRIMGEIIRSLRKEFPQIDDDVLVKVVKTNNEEAIISFKVDSDIGPLFSVYLDILMMSMVAYTFCDARKSSLFS